MSRFRFRIRTLLALPLAAALLLLALDAMSHTLGAGPPTTVRLPFLVLDAATGGPIAGASIRIAEDRCSGASVGDTDRDGRATAALTVRSVLDSSLFRRTRTLDYDAWQLLVSADGYDSPWTSLPTLTSDRRYHDVDAVPPTIAIRLGKAAAKS